MNFMFDLEDASNDGAIDASEFAIVCSSYGLDKAECEDAFKKMSQVCAFFFFFPLTLTLILS
jgi:hypothetical protein